MARPRNRTPSLKRKPDGRWYCTVGQAWIPIAPAGTPAPDAQRLYAEFLTRYADDPECIGRPAGTVLFAELTRDFLKSDERPGSAGQRTMYAMLPGLLADAFGDPPPVASYTADYHRRFKQWLLTRRAGGELRWNVTSVNKFLACTVRLLRFALSRRQCSHQQVAEVQSIRKARRGDGRAPGEIAAADPAVIEAVLPHLSPVVRAIAIVQRETGMRPGEVCRLRGVDLLLTGTRHVAGVGTVDTSDLGCAVVILTEHKTRGGGDPHVVPLSARAVDAIRPLLRDGYLFPPDVAAKSYSSKREHYTPQAYNRALRRACVRAGVARITPYQLRYLAAAEADQQAGTDGVMAKLRHKSVRMSRHYAKRNLKLAARLAKGEAGG